MSVFVPVSFRPKVVNVGPNYLVVLHGITLMTCSTRSKARSVAKWLFKFNRVMQDVSEVHTVSWANAWANYFDNASNPLGDFKPLMNVVAD